MTDENENVGEVPELDELAMLKKRADMMSINYHPSIGLDKLKEKINAALASEGASDVIEEVPTLVVAGEPKKETQGQKAVRLRKECNRLVRIRVTCMNPNKGEWPGELFTVSNSLIGTLKKFVPFNSENGWHVPEMIVKMMEERRYSVYYTVVINGHKIRKSKMSKEFSIEYLDPLTYEQLKDLAHQQALAGSIDRPEA